MAGYEVQPTVKADTWLTQPDVAASQAAESNKQMNDALDSGGFVLAAIMLLWKAADIAINKLPGPYATVAQLIKGIIVKKLGKNNL